MSAWPPDCGRTIRPSSLESRTGARSSIPAPSFRTKSTPSFARSMTRAVFLDRDGTIIEDPGYLHKPEQVKLLPGAAEAIRRLNAAGYLAVVVTNQSGIARGLYTVADYRAVEKRLGELLAAQGARIDVSYFCPHHPQAPEPCACRKPRTKLFLDAQAALGIDFKTSWWVGIASRTCSRRARWAARGFWWPQAREISTRDRLGPWV